MNILELEHNAKVAQLEQTIAQYQFELAQVHAIRAVKLMEAAAAGEVEDKPVEDKAAAKRAAAGKKASDDVAKVKAAAAKATQTVEEKAAELEQAVTSDVDEADEFRYTEGKLNVLGGLGPLRHLGKDARAPYVCDVDLKIDHTKAKANGVIYSELVNEMLDSLGTAAPKGTAKVPESDGMAKATKVIGKELVDHMASRVDQATFVADIKALYKACK